MTLYSNDINFRCHLDRERISSASTETTSWYHQEILKRNLVLNPQNTRVSFCGLIMKGSDLRLFFPRKTEISALSINIVENAVLLTNCIERFAHDSKTAVPEESALDASLNINSLTLVRYLLNDYQRNGDYINKFRRRTINTGKTNWNRTIKDSRAHVAENGSPVYLDLHGDTSTSASDSEVAKIHRAVILSLDKKFGWWVTGKRKGKVAANINVDPAILLNKADCVRRLKAELQQSYSDRNINLLTNLIKYIDNNEYSESGAVVIGIKEFHWAWEKILKSILVNTIDLGNILPLPTYTYQNGSEESAGKNQMRPDCIVANKNETKVVVVDAKYYDATNSSNAPPWSDIVKQLFYAKAIKKARMESKIGSVFIFPGLRNSDNCFSCLKMKSNSTEIFYGDEFPDIDCMYIDPIEAMQHYANFSTWAELSQNILDND